MIRVFVLVLVLALGGCVGSGKTPRGDILEPFPAGMSVVSDTTSGCREGESGFDYRFLVVGPASLEPGSALLDHIRSRSFLRDGTYLDDLPWVTTGYQHVEHPLRIEVGPLDRYLREPTSHTGPPPESLPENVRTDASRYVLLAMRPTDFRCSTPL